MVRLAQIINKNFEPEAEWWCCPICKVRQPFHSWIYNGVDDDRAYRGYMCQQCALKEGYVW